MFIFTFIGQIILLALRLVGTLCVQVVVVLLRLLLTVIAPRLLVMLARLLARLVRVRHFWIGALIVALVGLVGGGVALVTGHLRIAGLRGPWASGVALGHHLWPKGATIAQGLLVLLVLACGAGAWVLWRTVPAWSGPRPRLDLGKARHITLGELRRGGWLERAGQPLGRFEGKMVYMPHDVQAAGTLTVAPTRQGKSSRVVGPAILAEARRAATALRSIIVFDPKNEYGPEFAAYLARTHRVLFWNPLDAGTERYDPLGYACTPKQVQDLMRLWEAASSGGDGDAEKADGAAASFFRNLVINVLTGAALYVRSQDPAAPFVDVAQYVRRTPLKQMVKDLDGAATAHPDLTDAAQRLRYLASSREAGGSMADIVNRLEALALPEVRQTCTRNTIDWARFVAEPTALFISISEEDVDAVRPLLGAFMGTAMRQLNRVAGAGNKKLPRAVRVYIDEFANLGRLHKFDSIISMCAYRDIGIEIATQSLLDVRAIYGDLRFHRIVDNCNTKILLPNASLDDRKLFSEIAGNTTVRPWSRQHRDSDFLDLNASKGETAHAHPLFGPEQLRVMDETLLVIAPKLQAFTLRMCPWYEDKRLVAAIEQAKTDRAARRTITLPDVPLVAQPAALLALPPPITVAPDVIDLGPSLDLDGPEPGDEPDSSAGTLVAAPPVMDAVEAVEQESPIAPGLSVAPPVPVAPLAPHDGRDGAADTTPEQRGEPAAATVGGHTDEPGGSEPETMREATPADRPRSFRRDPAPL